MIGGGVRGGCRPGAVSIDKKICFQCYLGFMLIYFCGQWGVKKP